MPCIVVLKEKIVPLGKTLFMGGGAQLGVGSGKNVSSKENSPAPCPRDFINERSSGEFALCEREA